MKNRVGGADHRLGVAATSACSYLRIVEGMRPKKVVTGAACDKRHEVYQNPFSAGQVFESSAAM